MKRGIFYQITPLGAAMNEAPTQAGRSELARRFRTRRECRTSRLYPTPLDVERFYAKDGLTVIGLWACQMLPPAPEQDPEPFFPRAAV